MRETIIALIVTAIVAVTLNAAIQRGYEVAELEQQVTALERQVQARQLMLDDLHRIIPHIERRVAKVDTDLTAREVIWHLQEAIGDCPGVEVY